MNPIFVGLAVAAFAAGRGPAPLETSSAPEPRAYQSAGPMHYGDLSAQTLTVNY